MTQSYLNAIKFPNSIAFLFYYFYLKNEVNDGILKTIQGPHVELKITQKNSRELVMTLNLIVSYHLNSMGFFWFCFTK